ncbi:MAG: methyltransferase domain-containing protein [Balneolaceae bacterium]
MPFFLSHRQPDLVEFMDKVDCDLAKLNNTYKQFSLINGLLSNWKRIYKNQLKILMTDKTKQYSLLDIGFGGGDIPISISKWAKADGLNLQITAIETDERAYHFAQSLPSNSSITFQHCSSTDLINQKKNFDFVISNHVLHHLDKENIDQILDEANSLANQLVIFNDIERSDLGYILFNFFSRPLFRNSFITADGLISIKKCYTKKELMQLAPKNWTVERSFPFRLLLTLRKGYNA